MSGEAQGRLARASRAEATWRMHDVVLRRWTTWATAHGATVLPADPDAVAAWLAELFETGLKAGTVESYYTALRGVHTARGLNAPKHTAITRLLAGARRIGGPPRGKRAATADLVERFVATLPDTLAGVRDRTLILLGFAGALRRGELVALVREDLEIADRGVVVVVRRGKTDQEAAGRVIPIPRANQRSLCAVSALEHWLVASGITAGPVFRAIYGGHIRVRQQALRGAYVDALVQRCAAAAGLDAPDAFGGHSLRAGYVTEARRRRIPDGLIQAVTGHRRREQLDAYTREEDPWRRPVAKGLGL